MMRQEPRPDVCLEYGPSGVRWRLHSDKYPGAEFGLLPRSRNGAIKAARRALVRYRKRWSNLGPGHGREPEAAPSSPGEFYRPSHGAPYEWIYLPEGVDDSGVWVVTA